MSKAVTYIVTFLVIFILLPYGIYKFWFNYQTGLYPSLTEYESYTSHDDKYTVDVMKYKSVSDGDEKYTLKVYLTENKTEERTYITTETLSAYGSEVEFSEDKATGKYEIYLTMKSNSSSEKITIDCLEKRISGQKVPGLF